MTPSPGSRQLPIALHLGMEPTSLSCLHWLDLVQVPVALAEFVGVMTLSFPKGSIRSFLPTL